MRILSIHLIFHGLNLEEKEQKEGRKEKKKPSVKVKVNYNSLNCS